MKKEVDVKKKRIIIISIIVGIVIIIGIVLGVLWKNDIFKKSEPETKLVETDESKLNQEEKEENDELDDSIKDEEANKEAENKQEEVTKNEEIVSKAPSTNKGTTNKNNSNSNSTTKPSSSNNNQSGATSEKEDENNNNKEENTNQGSSSNNEDNTSSTNVKKLICGKTYQPEGYMNEYWEMKFKNDILDTLYINIIVDYTKVGVEPTEEFREELERYYKDTMVGYNVTVWKNGGSLDIRLTSDYQTLIKYGAETDDFLYQTLVNDMQSDGYYCS